MTASVPSRVLQALGRAPLAPTHRDAVAEILYGPGVLCETDIEGRASEAHNRLVVPVEHPDPRILARCNGLRVVEEPGLARDGLYLLGAVYYRPHRLIRAQGWTVAHETSHGLLDGVDCTHADVQRLALALLAPRAWVVAALRRYGVPGAKRILARAHAHAPTALLRLRVERVLLAADAA